MLDAAQTASVLRDGASRLLRIRIFLDGILKPQPEEPV
jgi:hypothetical protein